MSSSGGQAELISDLGLRSVTDIPEKYQHIFSGYPCFNAIQSKLLDFMLQTDESLVVSAPTGSGKTVLFELAIIRLLLQAEEDVNQGRETKIVYMAPVKALVSEKYGDWVEKFSWIGVRCLEVTGDSDNMSLMTIKDYQLILTTPEKWDSMTRRWNKTDHLEIMQQVRLFLIDEVHLLNEERRGSTLEAVVSRMKTVQKTIDRSGFGLRFVAVSATIPNGEDLAVWLGTSSRPARFAKIGEDMRPVKLKKVVLGFRHDEHRTPFAFDMSLSYHLKNVILKYSNGKPTLVFCNSRKSVQTTSSILVKQIKFQLEGVGQHILVEAANQVSDATLADLLKAGIGNHHAGMTLADRCLIEKLFRDGKLPVLITTSTLAMGVNLPAHLVVIKSTDCYNQSEMKPYTDSQLLQMIGRAGRPQFDTSAIAVIMTKITDKDRFERLVSGTEPIESTLHKNLAELLNAEVVLRTVTDVAVAVDWISSTYFYVRASRCPQRYGLPGHLPIDAFHARLHDMCMIELNGLARYKIIEMSEGYDVSPTEEGSLMAKYYIRFDTMKQFLQMKSDESIEGLLQLLTKSGEFTDVRLRVVEKRLLNSLNGTNKDGERIRFPIKEKIKSKEMKINCLIQATLDGRQVYDNALNQEAKQILRIASRLSRGLVLLVWSKGYFRSLLSALYLSKSLHCSMWENSTFVSRQVPGIGPALSTLLVMAGKTSFRSLLEANPRDLETILNRNPPFGNNLQKDVMCLPMYDLELRELRGERSVEVRLAITNKESVEEFGDLEHKAALVVGVGGSSNTLLHKENIRDRALILRGGEYCFNVSLDTISDFNEIEAHIISSTVVGLDVVCKLKMSGSPPSPFLQRQQNIQTCIDKYMKKKKKNIAKEKSPKICKVDKNEAKRLTKLKINIQNFICKAKGKKSISELSTASPEEENADEMKSSSSSENYSHEEGGHGLNQLVQENEQTRSGNSEQLWPGCSHPGLENVSDIDSGYNSAQAQGNGSNNRFVGSICEDSNENYDLDLQSPSLSKDSNNEPEGNIVTQICSKYKGSNSIFKWTQRIPRFSQPKARAAQVKTSYEERLVQGICDGVRSKHFSQKPRTPLRNISMQPTRKVQSICGSMKITDYLDKSFASAKSLIGGTKSIISETGFHQKSGDSSRLSLRSDSYCNSYLSSFQHDVPKDASLLRNFRTTRGQEYNTSEKSSLMSNHKVQESTNSKSLKNSSMLKSRATRVETARGNNANSWNNSSDGVLRPKRASIGEVLVNSSQVSTFRTNRAEVDRMALGAYSEHDFRTSRTSEGRNSSVSSLRAPCTQVQVISSEDFSNCGSATSNVLKNIDIPDFESTLMSIKVEQDYKDTYLHDAVEEPFEPKPASLFIQSTSSPIHSDLRADSGVSTRSVDDPATQCLIHRNLDCEQKSTSSSKLPLSADLDLSTSVLDNQSAHCLIENFGLRNTKFYPIFSGRLNEMLDSTGFLPKDGSTPTDERLDMTASQRNNQVNERVENNNYADTCYFENSTSKTVEDSESDSHSIVSNNDAKDESKDVLVVNLNQSLNTNEEVCHSSTQRQRVEVSQSNSALSFEKCSQITSNSIPEYLENQTSEISYGKLSRSSQTVRNVVSNDDRDSFGENKSIDVSYIHPPNEQNNDYNFSQQQFFGNKEVDASLVHQDRTTNISRCSEDTEINYNINRNRTTENLNLNRLCITKNQRSEMSNLNDQTSYKNQCFESKNLPPNDAMGLKMENGLSANFLQEKSQRTLDFHAQFQEENDIEQKKNEPLPFLQNISQESRFFIDSIVDDLAYEDSMRPEVNTFVPIEKHAFGDARKNVNTAGNKSSTVITQNYHDKSEQEQLQNNKTQNSPVSSQAGSHEDEGFATVDDFLNMSIKESSICPQKSTDAGMLEQTENAYAGNDEQSSQPFLDAMPSAFESLRSVFRGVLLEKLTSMIKEDASENGPQRFESARPTEKSTTPTSKYELNNMGSIEKCQRYLKNQQETMNNFQTKNKSIDTVKCEEETDDILVWDTKTSRYISCEEEKKSREATRNDRNYGNLSTSSYMNFPIHESMGARRELVDYSASENKHGFPIKCMTDTSEVTELHVPNYDELELITSEEFSPPMFTSDYIFSDDKLHGNELSFCSGIKENSDYKLETSALNLLEKCETKPVGCWENCGSNCSSKALEQTCGCHKVLEGCREQDVRSGCQMMDDGCQGLKRSSYLHCGCGSSDASGVRYSMPVCPGIRDHSCACHPQLKDKPVCLCFATRHHHMPNHPHSFPDSVCSFPSCVAPCHVASSNRCIPNCSDVTRTQPMVPATCSCSLSSRSYVEGNQCYGLSQMSGYHCGDGGPPSGFGNSGSRDFISSGDLQTRPSDDNPTSSFPFTSRVSTVVTATSCGCCSCEPLSQSTAALSQTNNNKGPTTPF